MASINDDRTGMRNQSGAADLIMKGAIALVTAAFFIGAYLQFRVTFWLALVAALSVYITLLTLHALMRRSEKAEVLATELSKLEGELARYRDPADTSTGPTLSPR
jgi:membrane protein implicated in regulation of membrane protease activity